MVFQSRLITILHHVGVWSPILLVYCLSVIHRIGICPLPFLTPCPWLSWCRRAPLSLKKSALPKFLLTFTVCVAPLLSLFRPEMALAYASSCLHYWVRPSWLVFPSAIVQLPPAVHLMMFCILIFSMMSAARLSLSRIGIAYLTNDVINNSEY